MESLRRRASGMDAARELGVPSVKGHGWPLYAGPRSADGVREVERSETRMQGRSIFGYFFPGRAGASGKSDSPSRAKQKLSTSSKNGSGAQSALKTGHISSIPLAKSPKTSCSKPSPNLLSQNRHIPRLPSAAVPGWTR